MPSEAKEWSVIFWSGVNTVTGANFMLEGQNVRILIDCGMVQGGSDSEKENNKSFPYDPSSIDHLFVTHAHMDHVGRIPKLVKDGFHGKIYSTPETKSLAKLMLANAAGIQESQSKERGAPPIFDKQDVDKSFVFWETIDYHQEKLINQSFSVRVLDAGHILGSSMYEFVCKKEDGKSFKIVFTGDVGNSPSILLRDTEPITGTDYLVMESVYGDRNHEPKEFRDRKFKEVVIDSIKNKGTLLIPAFSLERAQTILYELNKLIESAVIPKIPVFLDSPLAIELTTIYESITSLYNEKVRSEISKGDDIFDFPRLKETARSWESRKIFKTPNPKIIIAGSGMSTAGRVLSHEKYVLPDKNSTLLLVGYQAPGTLGREIQSGAKEVMIGDEITKVNAQIITIDGYSAHKDSDHLVEFVGESSSSIKGVFVVMGEPKSARFLAQRLRDDVGVKAVTPEPAKTYPLS